MAEHGSPSGQDTLTPLQLSVTPSTTYTSLSVRCPVSSPVHRVQATAEAICKRIGLFEEDESPVGKSFSGRELEGMSQEKQKEACLHAK